MYALIVSSCALSLGVPATVDVEHSKQIRGLLPEAASISLGEWERMIRPGATPLPPDASVTSLFLALNPIAKDMKTIGDKEKFTRNSWLTFVEKSAKKGYVSVLQPEGITDFTCQFPTPTTARGTVTFQVAKYWELKVEYRAVREKDTWSVREFNFPKSRMKIERKEGKWVELQE